MSLRVDILNNSSQPLFVECWFCSFFYHSGFAILTLIAILTFLFDYLGSVKEKVVYIATCGVMERLHSTLLRLLLQ